MTARRNFFKQLLAVAACVATLTAAAPALAQAANPKIAADLARTIGTAPLPAVTWAKVVDGQARAKVLVVASSSDATLADLRKAILAQGGSVHYVYASVRALSGMVPVSALNALAARGDVLAIAPTAWPHGPPRRRARRA